MNGCRLHAPPRLPRRVPIDRSDALRRSINQWTIDLYGAVGAGRVDQDQPTDCLQSESRPYPEGALRDGCLGGPPQPLAPPTHHCITAVHQNAHASSSYFRRYRIQPSLPLSHSFFRIVMWFAVFHIDSASFPGYSSCCCLICAQCLNCTLPTMTRVFTAETVIYWSEQAVIIFTLTRRHICCRLCIGHCWHAGSQWRL